jgi:TPR repeat protein
VWAQNNLGLMYRDGRGGLRKDYAEAGRWLEKAAAQGHERAQVNLAKLKREGKY